MFGFIFGAACLVGLFAVARGGRRRGRHGRWGGGPWRGAMRRLFERLDTTPGQEKVIVHEMGELEDKMGDLKREVKRSGDDVARAMTAEQLDETILGEVFARHDDALREVRKTMVGSLARVHDALDEGQRKRLAEMLESGGRFRGFGGPYRGWA